MPETRWGRVLPLALLAALAFGSLGFVGHADLRAGGSAVAVVDGDTLEIDGRVVDLFGVDAPELGQLCRHGGGAWHCGVTAAQMLRKVVDLNRGQITCGPWQAGGPPAEVVCQAHHADLAEAMLREGYAVAAPPGVPPYVEAQREAEEARLGLWGGRFVPPWRWRAGERLPPEPGLPVEVCNVKGVVGAGGERLYYVPTDPGYQAIEVDPAEGGALYCSDEEARARGWRRPAEVAAARRHDLR